MSRILNYLRSPVFLSLDSDGTFGALNFNNLQSIFEEDLLKIAKNYLTTSGIETTGAF
jgi:hypothetical protein